MNTTNKNKVVEKSSDGKQIDIQRSRITKTGSGGILGRIVTPIREWRELPQMIRGCPERSQKNLTRIHERLIDYRLALMKTSYIAKNVNHQIWVSFQDIKDNTEALAIETDKNTLIFHTNKYLKNLLSRWEDLFTKQEDLLDSISRAPASLKFYNMMMTYKDIRQRERVDDEVNERRYNEAYNSLEMALDYVEEYINKKENKFFDTSRLLVLEDARQYWSDKLAEINNMQNSGKSNIENILEKIDSLKNIIFESPPMAKWIFDVEQRYFRLVGDHELLNKMYEKTVIRSEEIKESNVLMTELIPKMWATGDYEQLDYYINQIEMFIKTYEKALQDELAYQERHSPWSMSGDEAKETDEIAMLISFVRIMINAIESRESHMGDHSETVARLARKTAEELNWTDHELKFLEIAGLMHDVGKIWIPESLLTKPGPLTENEYQVLRLHPFYSAKIVESISALKDIVPWVYYHHERWDGKGYPENLRQNEIPMGASIIAVAEAFSSMIFNTLSRKPLSIDEAFEQIRDESGKQFDPDVTEAFIKAASAFREDLIKSQENGFTSPV